jgi:transposase
VNIISSFSSHGYKRSPARIYLRISAVTCTRRFKIGYKRGLWIRLQVDVYSLLLLDIGVI